MLANEKRTEHDVDDIQERERLLDERERRADDRDDRADLRDVHQADRAANVNEILAGAESRDIRANARDIAAGRRDEEAALDAMVYGASVERPFKGRREAAKDRQASRDDRSTAHLDRYLLTGTEPSDPASEDEDAEVEPD